MKISRKQLRYIIREELASELDEVEPVEDAWEGGENLEHPIDHSVRGGSEAVTAEPEVLSVVGESRARGVFNTFSTSAPIPYKSRADDEFARAIKGDTTLSAHRLEEQTLIEAVTDAARAGLDPETIIKTVASAISRIQETNHSL